MRHRGYVRVGRVPGLDCDQPLRVVRGCGAVETWACGCHKASKCVPCSGRFRRRLARIAEAGQRVRGSRGHLYLLTLTAPGVDDHGLWDPGFVRGSRPACSCHVGVQLADWNAHCSAHWNRLLTALRRTFPGLEFLRAVEVQERGALHLHILVWSPEPLDVLGVQRLAVAAGFGCVLDLERVDPESRRAARYIAKYVTKSVDSRDDVPWRADVVDYGTGEIRRMRTVATFRAWSASRGWGMTMKAVREASAAAVRARLAARSPDPSPASFGAPDPADAPLAAASGPPG